MSKELDPGRMMNLIFGSLDVLSHPEKVAAARVDAMTTHIGDCVVDTCLTPDVGWETGIRLDDLGEGRFYTVRHYPDKETATVGHAYWVTRITRGISRKQIGAIMTYVMGFTYDD